MAKGKTFVIGVVEPLPESLECNGAKCEVSKDGAFIGYAPFEALPSPVRQGTNECDVAFEFIARVAEEACTNRVWCVSPRSPFAARAAEEAFLPPKPVRVLQDVWLGVRRGEIGRMLFAPEGAFFQATSAGAEGWRVRLEAREEAVLPLDLGEAFAARDRAPSAWLIEEREGLRVAARPLGGGDAAPSSGAPCLWGFDFEVENGRAKILPRPPPDALSRRADGASPLRGWRICLDPGHHPDRGAVGPRGLEERDSNLRIARETARLLRAEGAKTSFTREEDPLPLRDRHRRIRDLEPDVVVSLHNNSVGENQDPRARHGTQTFWVHPWSKDLAEKLHAAMLRTLGTTDLGCLRRDLYLPRYPGCPTVLLEPEYLILPEMEACFLDDAWRTKLAGAIVEGLRDFVLARRATTPPSQSFSQ
ncbi:MAG: N-acetylmuramoyl-L-alanine amidase [Verrucomicrobiae bacterium]|nr:N-acetylmuramoyl-L-alanine amidase [Verrucomicrobiae bacterium]